ncbi:MAG TPA: lysozyme [Azospirillum sp.]|nr:lysozyme [Azospirillum sp.]
MPICKAAIDLVKEFEGLYLKAYRCPAGVPSIGWGHTRGVTMGQTTTQAQAEKWLAEDLEEAGRAVDRLVTVPISQNARGALASFVFNLGSGALGGSTLLRLLNAERPAEEVAQQFGRWTKATVNGAKVDLPGLVKRRAAEAALFLTPDP